MTFPAVAKGNKDEEASVTEGISVFIFFLTKQANTFNEEFKAFTHVVDVGCGDCEEQGDGR